MATKLIVYHSGYGCDTGCCGHAIEVEGTQNWSAWVFDHPEADEDLRAWAQKVVTEEMGAEHVKDLDWDNCEILTYERCP